MPSTRVGLALICVHSLVISFVLTTPGASADTINACAKESNGKLRLVADPGRLQMRLGPAGAGPWVARVGLAGGGLEDVADQD